MKEDDCGTKMVLQQTCFLEEEIYLQIAANVFFFSVLEQKGKVFVLQSCEGGNFNLAIAISVYFVVI